MSWGSSPWGSSPWGAGAPTGGAGFQNPSFEIPALDGVQPAAWDLTQLSSVEVFADFVDGAGFPLAAEGFEVLWGADDFKRTFVPSDLSVGTFSAGIQGPAKHAEGFEIGWSQNQHYLRDLSIATTAIIGPGPDGAEDFEQGWADPYLFAFVSLAPGILDTFESGWSNDSYAFTLGSATAAVFAGAFADAVETFEHVRLKTPTQYLTVSHIWDCPAHGLVDGYLVQLTNPAGQLPKGFVPDFDYEVTGSTTDQFNLRLVGSGVTISSDDPGTGLAFVSDGVEFWTGIMLTL